MRGKFRIGELARRSACGADTIRYYEREGLLPPPARTAANYRLYGDAHVARLSFIRNCRALDMTLVEIRRLLALVDAPQVNRHAAHTLLDDHIAHVAARLSELKRLQTQLFNLRQECRRAPGGDDECGILGGLGRSAPAPKARRSAVHVRGAHRDGGRDNG